MSSQPDQRMARYVALNLVSQPVWVFDIDHRSVFWANTAALQVWNAPSLDELCRRDMGRDMSESVAQRLAQYQIDFVAGDAVFNEQWTLYPSGLPVSLSVRFSGHRLDDGRMAMLCEASPTDSHAPESLRSVEALLHTAVMISLYGNDGRALYRNPAARAAVISPDERLEDRIAEPAAYAALTLALARQGVATHTLSVQTPQGERWHELSARRCRDAVTGQDAILVSEADISAVKRTEERANFLALHDELTGLPNRSHVMQRFDRAVADIGNAGQEAALVFIDLDHFKDVNDTLGHAAGDKLLVHVAQRLRQVTRSTDLVARLGGDEFLILMVSSDIRVEVNRVQERLMKSVSEPLTINGTEVRVTPSAGVALYPQDGTDVETLLRNADLAMYTAKNRGRNDLAYFDERMAEAVRSRTELETELRHAFERDEFEVYYQPRVAVTSGRIVGAEALVRWNHPERGLVGPDVFIPTCESTGLIRQLGNQVFAHAARQQAIWSARGHDLQVSVNLSARQLAHPDLLADIARAIHGSGGNPQRLEVEITESMLLGHDRHLQDLLWSIEQMGISIALDDFGTGYSNLAYLQRFPIKTLKIDKAFIQSKLADQPLTEVIVSMCKLMKFKAVAEGVETAEQLQWVMAHDIEQYQGYLFARALPVAAFDLLLQ
ncbi:MAG TPA: EAL domain-containing protein [Burkholderiaceae bacterium]|mgnify:CR=1 FL=1|nr:EAL domain-containing protein [Burkholderiaceae bacterium]